MAQSDQFSPSSDVPHTDEICATSVSNTDEQQAPTPPPRAWIPVKSETLSTAVTTPASEQPAIEKPAFEQPTPEQPLQTAEEEPSEKMLAEEEPMGMQIFGMQNLDPEHTTKQPVSTQQRSPPSLPSQHGQPISNAAELREAPPGLDQETMSLWCAIDSLDDVLSSDFVDALLAETASLAPAGVDSKTNEVPREWRGLPHDPHYRTILQELLRWGGSGVYPLSFATGPLLPCCITSESGDVTNEAPSARPPAAARARTLAVARAARERSPEAFRTALERLGAAGVARLLGCRETPGSVAGVLPPLRATLAAAARVRVGRKRVARISVSARALMKHCGRMGAGWDTCYWGAESIVMHGGDEEKNARAESVVEKVLDCAVWMNIHHAPGGTRVLELRVDTGHGVRWHAVDAVFRGFLEPHSRELAVKKKEERKNRFKDTEGKKDGEGAGANEADIKVGNKDEVKEEDKVAVKQDESDSGQ